MRSVAISMRPGFNPGDCCWPDPELGGWIACSGCWDSMFGWFLAQLVSPSPRFLNRAIRRRLIVIVEASPVLNIRDCFASLIIAAHFVLRAVRALRRAGLAFVPRCRWRGGWSDRLVLGSVFGFGFMCGRASSGFPFSVCILLLRVFRVSVHSYWGCVSLDMDVLLQALILCLGSKVPRIFLLQGVAVRS